MFGASGRQRADLNVLQNIIINPLPIETQRKIAAILSAYDDLIENNTCRIQILEEMAQWIYREWFVHFRFPGHENVKLVDSELGRIPEGWRSGKVGDLYSVKSGFAFKSSDMRDDGEFGIIKIKNIQSNSIDIDNVQYLSKHIIDSKMLKFALFDGDLLIAMTGAQVGKVGIMPKTNSQYLLNQRVGKFFPKRDFLFNNIFIYQYVISDQFQTSIFNIAQGAAQPNISGEQIESIKMLLPKNELIEKYQLLCESSFDLILNLGYKNMILRQTRDLLLPKLISGKIDVSELDIDIGNLGE